MSAMTIPELPETSNEWLRNLALYISVDKNDIADDLEVVFRERDEHTIETYRQRGRAYAKTARIYRKALNELSQNPSLNADEKTEVDRLIKDADKLLRSANYLTGGAGFKKLA